MFQMNFSGDVTNGREVLLKIDFSIDIRDQLAKKNETDSVLLKRIEGMPEEIIRSELWSIAYNDRYIYNTLSEFISYEINDYAAQNNLDDSEYEDLSCKNKRYNFFVGGRIFEFKD